jgi:riboflavin synthase
MFTGIVDHTGIIKEVKRSSRGVSLKIESQFHDFVLGESIAVNGVCLTVIEFDLSSFFVEVSPETERLTTCRNLNVGALVNLERAMKASDRFGGHWVSGHVEQTAKVERVKAHEEFREIVFTGIDSSRNSFITPKGSITVNGVSLTVNEVMPQGFSVMLIPHTLERTNLSMLSEGREVNIECDWMAKVVVNEVRQLFKSLQEGKSL